MLAVSLGLDDGAVGVSLGLGAPKIARMVEVSLVFGIVQSIFPAGGILIGQYVGGRIGHFAGIIGYALLVALGLMTIYMALRTNRVEAASARDRAMLKGHLAVWIAGVAVSLDSLAVGISLGFNGGSLWLAVLVLGLSGLVMTFLGLVLGARVGRHFGDLAEVASGALLALTGVGLLVQKLFEMKVL